MPDTDILHALIDAIIPADDWPSGWQAGVGDYLLRQFDGDLADDRAAYVKWLAALDDEARAVYEQSFAELDLDERTRLLEAIEGGQLQTDWLINPAFFQQIVEHCHEGFYSDPGNGGNRDGISWRMIGFEVRG